MPAIDRRDSAEADDAGNSSRSNTGTTGTSCGNGGSVDVRQPDNGHGPAAQQRFQPVAQPPSSPSHTDVTGECALSSHVAPGSTPHTHSPLPSSSSPSPLHSHRSLDWQELRVRQRRGHRGRRPPSRGAHLLSRHRGHGRGPGERGKRGGGRRRGWERARGGSGVSLLDGAPLLFPPPPPLPPPPRRRRRRAVAASP